MRLSATKEENKNKYNYYKPVCSIVKIINGLEEIQPIPYAVVTAGTFDGVHLGHQKILKRLREIADACEGQTVLITYWPHPRIVLSGGTDTGLRLLSSFEEKIHRLEQFGLDYLIVLPFTKEFAALSSQDFIQQILIEKLHTRKLVIGYDHRFGKNREGSFEHLQANAAAYGFEVEEIPRQDVDEVGVSSTRIRKALEAGDIDTANHYLGAPYLFVGEVVHGQQIGRVIGFPTANIAIADAYKLIPAKGVYAVRLTLPDGRLFGGMMSIGTRPTVDNSGVQSIEVNIFDFAEDVYGQSVTVEVIAFMRSEQKFANLAALQAALYADKENALEILAAMSE